MKCLSRKRWTGIGVLFLTVNLFFAPLCLCAPGQTSAEGVSPRSASRPKTSAVQDILKMMDAGVSKEIIKTYVENSTPSTPTAEDLVALKQHSVPDEITTALVKRMAETKASPAPQPSNGNSSRATLAAPAPVAAGGQRPVRLDPESYEFWWYHYAYPRTLAYSYERLYPYSPVAPYQFYHPIPFAPRYGYPGTLFP